MEVCLYNTAPAAYLATPVGGRSTLDRVADWVDDVACGGFASGGGEASPSVSVYSTVDPGALPSGWKTTTGPALTQRGFVDYLAGLVADAESEVLVSRLDQPFLNVELTGRIIARHRDYRAEYTFADGYPTGLAPELVSGRAVSHLQQMADERTLLDRGGLFPIVQKDINRLDVETELSVVDQRLLRLVPAVDTRANLLLCERLADGAPESIDEWAAHVEARRVLHRTLPRFVSVQVVEQEVQKSAYSPYPLVRDDVLAPGRVMDADRFSALVGEIDRFAPEAVIHLSHWGEIALHPQSLDLVERVLATPSLTALVETSGVGWTEAAADRLFAIDSDRFMLIVGLDSEDEAVYTSVRGAGFDEARAFARRAVATLGDRTYIQSVRCDLTEPSLDASYRAWKELTANVIVEKFDFFSGRLPQRKVGDISPIARFPCWRLQRDLVIRVDGSVPLCREDIDVEETLGNVVADGVEACWNAGESRFADHVSGRYSGICEACDEYYTFTF